ncbi:hypothetical protein FPSE_10526 [Fusarium pseudograminearum CS3096]|uniref:Uncharacterized protein n=1 Tax=Fusarium pseudograminearum (strain CS3096) TaxID=1028729 RepID=K3VAS8_FUSPC|nr:hypothetical protein FPSE_10526 [Fusarium pseudograminearum CS3096]EKJ69273.1 hypothetical protein FPSE_10526 [Fusarium pseudograminearum CS3096]
MAVEIKGEEIASVVYSWRNASDASYREKAKASDVASENHTVLLINNVLRHILHIAQRPGDIGALEHREPKRMSYNTASKAKKVIRFYNNQPAIDDNVLAQMSCEAIVAKMSHRKEVCSGSVFVIHIAGRFVCFLQFNISDAYRADFRNGRIPSNPLAVYMTKWFDISKRGGRSGIIENACGLINVSLE